MNVVPSGVQKRSLLRFAKRLESLWQRLRFIDWMMVGLVVTLIGISAYFGRASPYFLRVENFLNIGSHVAIRGIVAVGLTIVMLAGGFDLTMTAVMVAASMVAAELIITGRPEWLATVVGLATGTAMGAANGLLITKGRINPVVATLSTMSIMRGVAFIVERGRSRGVALELHQFAFLARDPIVGGIPNPLIWWLLACALGFFILRYTVFGQYVYAIGGNSEACRVSGVRVDRWRSLTYSLSGFVSGFAGLVLLSLTNTAYAQAAAGAELDIIAAVILGGVGLAGGRGGVVGTILGTLILGVLSNGMTLTGIPSYWQFIARGVILVVSVALDTLRRGGGYR